MLETKRLQIKSQVFIMYLPLFREAYEFPFSAALFAAVIVSVLMLPATVVLRSVPDDLGIRANQDVFPPSLQFLSFINRISSSHLLS